ncbi:TetR/AcrR family transcriptional regulator [Agromyces allii]|uniref:TetR/AcrR family transcriptional regulator n=1 Tax=Agromyces allii TaxID=393607 RepID=A0ABN2R8V8_9MICO|nr:TetR/AcrR family transcriptional regulator [Agromyces allii]
MNDARADPTAAERVANSYPKGERRRAEIIETAFSVFASDSYRGASMVQIAAAVGISRAGLLHHFPTKESLLAAVLEERDRVNGVRYFEGADPQRDGIDYFRHLLRLVDANAGQRELVQLFATLSTEAADPGHPAHGYFVDRYRWLEADIDHALGEAASRGLLRPGRDLDGVARDLIALIDGLQIQWLIDPTGIDIGARLRRRLAEFLTADLEA